MVVSRRVRAEREVVLLGGVSKGIQDEAGLDDRVAFLGVQLDDLVDVLRVVDNNGYVAALSGEARAAAPRDNWRTLLVADRHRCDHILDVKWDDDADRHFAVVGGVGGIERAAARYRSELRLERVAVARPQASWLGRAPRLSNS